jgi:hypothetical protein
MKVDLIVSIDRKNTVKEAMEVISLALKFRHQGIVGLDLCGDPQNPATSLSSVLLSSEQKLMAS